MPNETTCDDGIGCVPDDAGTSGSGGASGSGGSGGSQPCGGNCVAPTPVCNERTNTCVECTPTNKSACTGSTAACSPTTNQCVECVSAPDCTAASKPLCDTSSNTCVQCLQNTNCTGDVASRCDAGSCVPCETNADCAHITGKGVCDSGQCVQCTGKDYASCGVDSQNRPRVCDSRTKTCSTQTAASQGLCQPCVSDAACKAGQLCVLQKHGEPAEDVGYFCFWRRGDTTNGAPAECFPGGRPFVADIVDAVSIDGVTADICGLRVSTCVARTEFSSKDCGVGGVGSDEACGFAPASDAKCDQVGTGSSFQCTMTCGGAQDCPPGFSCNTTVTQPYCEL